MARLATFIIQLLTIAAVEKALANLELCNGKKIFILDINTFAEEGHFPTCKLDEVRHRSRSPSGWLRAVRSHQDKVHCLNAIEQT